MKKALFLSLFLASVAAQAQNIRGVVSMEKDKSPAEFASVGLLQLPDSSIQTGVITLTDGGYSFDNVKPGDYFVKVNFLGYKPAGKMVTVGKSGTVTADTIFLAETATTIDEVTVVGERLKGKEMVDRTVYNIPDAIAKSSTNGYEILKKIPQVNVDFQNNITMNGSKNFIIQVDGRERDATFLAKLQPSDIQTVEVISNPGGKYEGNIDGVINIILKKEARYGINGNVGLNVKPINNLTTSATGSLDYAMGKVTFYVTAFTFVQHLDINSSNISHFKFNDSTASESGTGKIKVGVSNVNSGFDYYMNDKNSFSLNVSYKPIVQDIDMNSESFLYHSDVPVNTISTNTLNSTHSDETTVSLFYKHNFSKALQEFTADGSFYTFKSKQGNDFTNKQFPINRPDSLLSTYIRLEDVLNERHYGQLKLDYTQPLGLSSKLEFGYQLYYQQMDYDFNIDNAETSNLFTYKEFRNAAYGGYTYSSKKFGFQAVLRIEDSHIKADSVTDPHYACLLPSVNFQYKFSASHNLKLTYNRRINRPGIYDLDPYYRIGSNYDISQGNPNLKPDYRNRVQMTYTWNFGSNYFSPYVYYELLTDKVGKRYTTIEAPGDSFITTLNKPFNLLSGYEYGGGMNAMLWFVNINARLYKGHYDGYRGMLVPTSIPIPAKDYFSWAITGYAFHNLDKKKKGTAFAFLQYNGVNQDAQSKIYSIPFYGLGAQWQIKDHTIGFFYLEPFAKNITFQRTETETSTFKNTNKIGFDVSYYIQIMYSYKFNKGRSVKKLDRKTEIESDSKTQGISR